MGMIINVNVEVEVDPKIYAEAYGLEFDDVGPAATAIRTNADSRLKKIVLNASKEAVERLGLEAAIR